ncbi:ribosomal protein S18 acetylase RimI-like enzyme [Nocardioides ginsengisegetis]|uniref:Ribosomal protein S18 acetylase RimI-like enzyme n=1 Tax=Nocardioides ginsengisegetis TaxID=661491 RepID=A0A7W3J2K4_9ACTN|nr:GNAT family N-acetyltransferase [Nocardioides ginsengisegetis]MBA8805143.1 ribosomal protein S18 acetylase RimI-like enzyme [Nocardioides ginsengisegetis]
MSTPDTLTIRLAVPDDAEALTHLHLDCWDDAYTGLIPQGVLDERRANVAQRVDKWRGILGQSTNTMVAETTEGLVGFVSSGPVRDEDRTGLELWALYARAEVWGTGVGHALLVASIGDAPASLWVLEGNDRAIGFYERQGFRRDGHTELEREGLHARMVRNQVAPSAVDPA